MRDVALSFSARADEKILDVLKPKTTAQEQALLHITGCLLAAARDGCWVHYSRDRNWYPDRKRYYGQYFGYGPLMAVVDALSEAGLIDIGGFDLDVNEVPLSGLRPRAAGVGVAEPVRPSRGTSDVVRS